MIRTTTFVFIGILAISGGLFAQDNQVIYRAKDCILLTFKPLSEEAKNGKIIMKGEVASLVGKLSDVSVEFIASEDIEIETKSMKFAALRSGQPKQFDVVLMAGKGKSDHPYSWVSMHVSYNPDFKALIEAIASDTKEYPDGYLREKLLAAVRAVQRKGEKASQVTGHAFLSGVKF